MPRREWVWVSMNPGATTIPRASSFRARGSIELPDYCDAIAGDPEVSVVPRIPRAVDNTASSNHQIVLRILSEKRNEREQQRCKSCGALAPILTRLCGAISHVPDPGDALHALWAMRKPSPETRKRSTIQLLRLRLTYATPF